MKSKKYLLVTALLLLNALFLINWISFASITSFFTSLITNEEHTIPLPLPDVSIDHTGKASFSISIDAPPGAGDVIPSISLSYRSGSPDFGFLGKGWSLSGFPKVTKNSSFGIHGGSTDQYTSDLTGDLRSSSTSGLFKTKTETFQRVSKNTNGWLIREKTGAESLFGSIPASFSKIQDSSGNEIAWALDQVRDMNGNGYDITYFDSNSLADFAPKEIRYVRGNARIVFEYENRGSSFFKVFRYAQGAVRNSQLSTIRIFAKDASGTESEVATYGFSYRMQSGELLLETVSRTNYEPLTFSYTNSSPAVTSYSAASSSFQLTYRALDDSKQRDCDFAAMVCLCSASAACMQASFGLAGEVCRSNVENIGDVCQNGVENSFTSIVDVSGDGTPELIRVLGDKNGQYFSKLDMSSWENPTSSLPIHNDTLGDRLNLNANGRILPGDVNGDGKTDFVVLERNGQPVRIFYGPNFNSVTVSGVTAKFPNNASDSRNRHYVADMNGDGKADFIQANDQLRLEVFLSNGGGFNYNQTLTLSDFGNTFQQFADLDQNGVPDFIRIDGLSTQRLLVTFFESNGGTLQEIETSELNGNFASAGDQFLADVNGDGYVDFVYYTPTDTDKGYLNIRLFDGRKFHAEAGWANNVTVNGTIASQDLQNMSVPSSNGYALYDINNDSSPDRVYYFGDYYQIEIYNPSTDSYLPPFNVNWSNDTTLDINFDGENDRIRAGTFFLQQQINVWFGPNDAYHLVNVDQAAMTPPPADVNAIQAMSVKAYSNWKNRKEFADVNGDGRADFIRFYNGNAKVSFSSPSSSGLPDFSRDGDVDYSTDALLQTADLNGDGRSELIGLESGALGMAVPIPSNIPFIGTLLFRNIPFHSAAKPTVIRFTPSVPNGLIASVDSAYGRKLELTYDVAKQKVTPTTFDSSKPNVLPQVGPDFVVSKIVEKANADINASTTFQYRYPKLFWNGLRNLGTLGFSEIVQTDQISNLTTVTQYGDSSLELAGIANRSATYKSGILLSEISNNYTRSVLGDGTIRIRQNGSTQIEYQNGSALRSTNTILTYDSYGNTLNKTTSIEGSVLEEKTIYENDSSAWLFGKPLRLESYKDGELVSLKEYIYSGLQLYQEKTFMGGSQWNIQTILQYDSFGNPIQVQDTRGNIVQLEMDSVVHKFPVKITNGIGHTTTKEYDLTKGFEIANIDINGNRSETHYDKFGRVVETTPPGLSDPLEKVEYINTGHPTDQRVRTTIQREDGEESWMVQYFNSRGQATKKESSLVDAAVLVEESIYDNEGKLIKSIAPYLQGQAPFSWSDFEYDSEGRQKKVIGSDGKITELDIDGFDATTRTTQNGTLVSTVNSYGNEKGELLEKVIQGKSTKFQYKANGKIQRVTDPDNGITTIETDFVGRQTRVSNPNTGTVQYEYDSVGNLTEQRYGNGSVIRFQYDSFGRVISVIGTSSTGETQTQIYEYDDPSVANGKGRLTKVTDALGTTEFGYDVRGNQTLLRKRLIEDDMTFLIEKTYNFQNQIASVIYPDGTLLKNFYSKADYLSGITLTPGNGEGSDFPLVQYQGPLIDGSGVKIQRILGNGVNTDILFDPARKRPLGITVRKDGEVYQNLSYEYDANGNFTKIEDKVVPSRTQTFQYDSLNRLTLAAGKYGTEDYQYNDAGQILKKGNQTYSYTNPQHKTAVTRMVNPALNQTIDYAYDGSGNMIGRNEETMTYDPFQKLKRMNTQNGEAITFDYDFSGTRIRKTNTNTNTRTISLGGLYEVVLTPGKSPQHTLYFRGLSGDLVAQWSRTDAALRTSFNNEEQKQNLISWIGVSKFNRKKSEQETGNFGFSLPMETQTKVANVFSKENFSFISTKVFGKIIQATSYARIRFANLIAQLFTLQGKIFTYSIILLFGIGFVFLTKDENRFPILLRLTMPLLILSMNVSSCSVLMPQGSGDPPWILPPIVPATTPTVGQPYNSGGNGGGTSGAPVSGMIFFHPDHLGSITMITDGQGNRVAGGEMGGASFIGYKPYGEIQRNDSAGPDIFRYKYTGQEEDRETGLYYYNARYYDPVIGRFTQADSIFDTSRPMAMDLYMYTEGNPIRFRDPSGHSLDFPGVVHMFNQITGGIAQSFNSFIRRNVGTFNDRLDSLGSAANKFMHVLEGKGKRKETDSFSMSKINKGLVVGGKIVLAVACPIMALLIDPAFTLGFYFAALNLAVGVFTGAYVEYRAGGYLVHNAPFAGPGISIGGIAFVPSGADEATIQHELAHVRQYNNWGGWSYMEQTWQSPFNNIGNKGPSYAERNADARAGTNAYMGNVYFNFQFLYLMNALGINSRYATIIYELFGSSIRLIPVQ